MKSLIVEGWRFLPHSYAVVNQWQLLSLSRRKDLQLKIRDMPLYHRRWEKQAGLFDQADEEVLHSLQLAPAGEPADATYRITFPYDFSPCVGGKTAIFGTSENQALQRQQFADPAAYRQLLQRSAPEGIIVVTPSRWSAQGFYNSGFRAEQVLVIPHGVDVNTFHPAADPLVRDSSRAKWLVQPDTFMFLSIGSMTGNKGMDVLLRSFAEVSEQHPEARLVVKGTDALYRSEQMLRARVSELTAAEQLRLRDRLIYAGGSFGYRQMAELYQAADAYVSPYRAEGFNIPVLEAAACGIPIICTRGGSTEDFVTDEFALKIDSTRVVVKVEELDTVRLEPNREHLTALMTAVIEDHSWRERATALGPAHVRSQFTWDQIVERMTHALLE